MIRYALRPASSIDAPPSGYLRIFADETGAFKIMDAGRNVSALGGGSVSWGDISGTLALDHGGTGATTAAGARTALGLAIGSDVQAYSANLASFATVAPTAAGLALLDDADAAAQRVTLGLGTAALAATGDFATAGHNHAGTYQPLDADLTAIAALATTTFGRALLTEVDAASIRGTIGAGTVSSVALSLPSIFSVSGSPITASGTLAATLASQSANQFFAAPNGLAGAPAFRAIVAADIPVLNQNTTGSAASLTTGRTIGMTGDVVWTSPAFNGTANVSAAGTIQAGAVSLAKMADVATGTLFYRKTAGSGAPEVQTLATLKTDLGLTGTNSGDQTITLTGDVTGSGAGSFAATIANGAVGLAKMANMATASLIYRKTAGSGAPEVQTLATLKTDLGLTGTNSGDQTITLTGDVTGSGTGSFAATIANDAVSNAKLANMATATFKGRATAGTGDPEDLTGTQATALLDVFTSSLKGLAPASGGGTTNFLRADGSWAAPSGGGGGGWTQIGSTLTPTGVSSVEFNDIPATYSELVLVCEGLSHNFGSNTALRVNFSDNGVNWTADYTWGTSASAAVAWYGGLHIPHYTAPAGMAAGTAADLSSNNSLNTSSGVPAWRCAGGITDIRVKVNGGNFDAGTLKLYGRA